MLCSECKDVNQIFIHYFTKTLPRYHILLILPLKPLSLLFIPSALIAFSIPSGPGHSISLLASPPDSCRSLLSSILLATFQLYFQKYFFNSFLVPEPQWLPTVHYKPSLDTTLSGSSTVGP